MRTVGTSSEIKIEAHQETVAHVVFTREWSCAAIRNAGVLLEPCESSTRAHNGVPAVTNRPRVQIAEAGTNTGIRLPLHPNQLVSAHENQTRVGVVVAFDKPTVP